jgi:DNA transformation protein
VNSTFLDFVLDQLEDLAGLRATRMFGGYGLYLGSSFFGIVYDDRLYLKTDETSRPWYEDRGMGSFRPTERQHLKTYYEVPGDAIEDREQLVELAVDAAGHE